MADIENLAIELASHFLNLPGSQIDSGIDHALKHIISDLGFDRTTFFQQSGDGFVSTHCCSKPGIPKRVGIPITMTMPYVSAQAISARRAQTFSIKTLPDFAIHDRALLESDYGPRLTICSPLIANNKPMGVIFFGSFNADQEISEATFKHLALLSNILSTALLKKEFEKRALGEMASSVKPGLFPQMPEASYGKEAGGLIGLSPAMSIARERIRQAAATDSTVLITGETGTGKELAARLLHKLSRRGSRPMYAVNCATLSPELVESRLFGHEKGAFTGATRMSRGLFELASDSTLFLDEVGELSPQVQAKLLRAIQERQFERLGSTTPIRTNARIIAATNKCLALEVKNNAFRSDLYYRLNVFPIHLPPLRERIEDIPSIIASLIQRFNASMGKRIRGIRACDLELLKRLSYPGNVRELSNIIEHAFVLANGDVLALPPLPDLGLAAPRERRPAPAESALTLREAEINCILAALKLAKGRVSGQGGAAAILDINAKTLDSRMRKLGIKRGHFDFY